MKPPNLAKPASTLALLATLAACNTLEPRPDVVRERIDAELQEAASQRKPNKQAEVGMLPPLSVAMPVGENGAGLTNTEGRFDLMVSEAPAKQVFMALVNDTRYNMLPSQDIQPTDTITITLKDVTVIEALEAIRELYGYEFTIKGNRITIQPNTIQTRMFKVNYLAMARSGGSTLTVGAAPPDTYTRQTQTQFSDGGSAQSTSNMQFNNSSSGGYGQSQTQGPYDGSGSKVSTDNSIDYWADLKRDLEDIVGVPKEVVSTQQQTQSSSYERNTTFTNQRTGAPAVIVSKVSGTVVVRARPRDLRMVEEYLASSKFSVERQVMLEAKIIEVRLKQGTQSGINWASFNGNNRRLSVGVLQADSKLGPDGTGQIANSSAAAIPGIAGTLATSALGSGFVGLAFQTANFAALLNFLETQGEVSVLSSPRVATLNNQKAVLKVGTDEVYVSGFTMNSSSVSTGTTTTTSGVPSPQTARLFSGISLDVTPQIDEEGNIVLHIHPAISTVREVQKTFNLGTAGIITLPLASREVNETDSIVRAQDGNIVAIGGMMNQFHSSDRSGLPGTVNSTFGVLAGQREFTTSKSEMVILLKPTIIGNDRAWAQDIAQSAERMRNLGLPPLSVPYQ